MSDHICPHESKINQNNRTLFGNGNKGIVREVTELRKEMETMNMHVEKLATSYSALAKSQIEHDAIERQKVNQSKRIASAWQKIGIAFSIIIGAVGVLYVVLDHLNPS